MSKTVSRAKRSPRRGKSDMRWANWPQERLLDMRLCDLNVRIKGTALETRIKRVLAELKQKDLCFRPHFWVSDDWFTPERVPGCAVPFYLLHPRLTRLERHEMLEAEGADRVECMKILRHEVGHAVEHAYKLHRRRKRQRLFGKTTKRYPARYMPKPRSRKFVQHLDYWYAQAHPDEDFAETFAVWLNPRSNWRKRYVGWGALGKLEYMDELMREIADKPPVVKSRARVEPLRAIKKTLRRHYADKQKRYGAEYPDFLDSDLRRLFSSADEFARNETAAAFLRRARGEIRRMVSRWTGYNQYSLDSLLRDVIGRCRELELRLTAPPDRTKIDVVIMLTVNTMEFLYTGRRWISL